MESSRFQKILLIVLVGMTLVTTVGMVFVRSQKGVLFHDALLKVETTEENVVYGGKAHGEPVKITVTPGTAEEATVDIVIGKRIHDRCAVTRLEGSVATDLGEAPLVSVTRNDQEIFRGGLYRTQLGSDFDYILLDSNGEWFQDDVVFVVTSGTGNDYWDDYKVSARTVLKFAEGPERVARGVWYSWMIGLFFAVLAAVRALFPRKLFWLDHRWYVKNPEPTEVYFAMNRVGCCILTVAAGFFYIFSILNFP